MFRIAARTFRTGLATISIIGSAAAADDARVLPGGERSTYRDMAAYLVEPTTAYEHGVFGETVEARGFAVVLPDGMLLTYRLPRGPVFEDRRVRLADLDGDGWPEAVVVKSYPDKGAAIAVYRILKDRILPLAESTSIGKRFRWLNPVGVGHFTGDDTIMIAAVVTPHIRGSLRLYRLNGSALEVVSRLEGFTNHIYGTRNLDLAKMLDVDGDGVLEIVIPAQDRFSLAIVSFLDGHAVVRKRIAVAGAIHSIEQVTPETAKVRTEAGLEEVSMR